MSDKTSSSLIRLFAAMIIFADIFVWYQNFSSEYIAAREYFLDVGEGDSELIIFPGNIKVLIDAGSTAAVISELGKILPSGDDYIDLAIISEPELSDFGGYNIVLDHYRIGAFVYNGRTADPPNAIWDDVMAKISAKHIPLLTLAAGDAIIAGAAGEIDLLSPNTAFTQSAALSDTGLVELIKMPEFKTLLSADIGANVQDWLIEKFSESAGSKSDLRADVLKIPDHASENSLSTAFLHAIEPKFAVIESDGKNKATQTATTTLMQITSSVNALIFQTNKNGTIEIVPSGEKLQAIKEKE